MDVRFINPVLDAMRNVLGAMARVEVRAGTPSLKRDQDALGEVTGLMNLTGPKARISVAITFPEVVIERIAAQMLPPDAPRTRGNLADLAGELANMVAGSAKSTLEENGSPFELPLPIIILGKGHMITHRCHGPTILLPFSTDLGGYYVEVCYEA